MSTLNPYAPPRAAVADVHETSDGVQPVKTWSAQGRIGRLRYLAHMTGAYIVFFGLAFAAGVALGALRLEAGVAVVMGVGFIAYMWFIALKTIQRSHDMGWSGWSTLLAFIPFVGLIWIFKRGSEGSNRFGAPPPPNGLGVKVLGLMFPVVMGIGIVAAVALPAYQQYTARAAAAAAR